MLGYGSATVSCNPTTGLGVWNPVTGVDEALSADCPGAAARLTESPPGDREESEWLGWPSTAWVEPAARRLRRRSRAREIYDLLIGSPDAEPEDSHGL